MDELEISGKRYISTRRAAKENKYHSDYIGQLIRAGKVDGQKVGRSWYVEADSLTSYLSNESAPKNPVRLAAKEETPAPALAAAIPKAKIEIRVSEPEAEREEVKEKKEAPELEEVTADDTQEIEVENEIDEEERPVPVKIAGPAEGYMRSSQIKKVPAIQSSRSSLRYIEDDEPLYPPIPQPVRIIKEIVKTEEAYKETYEEEEPVSTILQRPVAKRARRGSYILRAGTVVVAGALTLALVAAASAFISATTVIQKGEPASTGFSVQGL